MRLAADAAGGRSIEIETPVGPHKADFIILGTGFAVDVAARAELSGLARDITLWRDVFTPPDGEDPAIARRLGFDAVTLRGAAAFRVHLVPGIAQAWF